MSSPRYDNRDPSIRNSGAHDFLSTALLGLFLMMMLTTWSWYAMR
jgi:hypothetical protein